MISDFHTVFRLLELNKQYNCLLLEINVWDPFLYGKVLGKSSNLYRNHLNFIDFSQAPIYTFWREFKSGADTIRDFIYWAFYPYNRGKNVCIGAAKLGRCWGGCTIMGNHVGDWEHVTVRLKNNRPYQMYVGAHNFGGVYTWNGHTFVKGKITFWPM